MESSRLEHKFTDAVLLFFQKRPFEHASPAEIVAFAKVRKILTEQEAQVIDAKKILDSIVEKGGLIKIEELGDDLLSKSALTKYRIIVSDDLVLKQLDRIEKKLDKSVSPIPEKPTLFIDVCSCTDCPFWDWPGPEALKKHLDRTGIRSRGPICNHPVSPVSVDPDYREQWEDGYDKTRAPGCPLDLAQVVIQAKTP
jgi:hypothetical protein